MMKGNDPTGEGNEASTKGASYSSRLARLERRWVRRLVDVQAPYRWNIRRLARGFVLDVGCGLGRNLEHLGGHGVGVDHNLHSVEIARSRGLRAFTPVEFTDSEFAAVGRFDVLLSAHVLEHLEPADAVGLLRTYLPYVRPGGRAILICPQRAGYRSDATHVSYLDDRALGAMAEECGLGVVRVQSFPFPRWSGRVFRYNETVVVAELPA